MCWWVRALSPGQQALLVLVHLRKGDDTAAARIWNILAALRDAGLIALGGKSHPLRKLRACPRRVGHLTKAIHALQNYELTTR